MWTYLVVHPVDWRHRVTPEQTAAVVEFLQREGVIGHPVPGEDDTFQPGAAVREKLGLFGPPAGVSVIVHSSPHLQIQSGPMDVHCPACGVQVFEDQWSRMCTRFYESQVEPLYTCPECKAQTGLTSLQCTPGAVFSYVSITFVEMGAAIRTDTELWHKLERLLGTKLTTTTYVV